MAFPANPTIGQKYTTASGIEFIFTAAGGWKASPATSTTAVISWTTAGRPANPAVGRSGLNTTTGLYEVWNGTAWKDVSDNMATYSDDLDAFIRINASGEREIFDFVTKQWAALDTQSATPTVRYGSGLDSFRGIAFDTGYNLNQFSKVFDGGKKIFTPTSQSQYNVAEFTTRGALNVVLPSTALPAPTGPTGTLSFAGNGGFAFLETATAGKFLWFVGVNSVNGSTYAGHIFVYEVDLTGSTAVVRQIGYLAGYGTGSSAQDTATFGVQACHIGSNKFYVTSGISSTSTISLYSSVFTYNPTSGTAGGTGPTTISKTLRHPTNSERQPGQVKYAMVSATEMLFLLPIAGGSAGQYGFSRNIATVNVAAGTVSFGTWTDNDMPFTDADQLFIDYIALSPDGTPFYRMSTVNTSTQSASVRIATRKGPTYADNGGITLNGHKGSWTEKHRVMEFPFSGDTMPVLNFGGDDATSTTRRLYKLKIAGGALTEVGPTAMQNQAVLPLPFGGRAFILPNGSPVSVPPIGNSTPAVGL